jgi:protein-S-isoprenylcysteine O-methyltransferase Ste14
MSEFRRGTIPRWMAIVLALLLWLIAIPLVHCGSPWAISTLMPRYGWSEGAPGVWNWLGLIPVLAGAALLAWVLAVGIAQTPERVRMGLTPSHLMTGGPYRHTRNPMYVAELGLWLGWAVFFGSAGVMAGCVVLWTVVKFVIVPREERGLEAAFGREYLELKKRAPRWWGVRAVD